MQRNFYIEIYAVLYSHQKCWLLTAVIFEHIISYYLYFKQNIILIIIQTIMLKPKIFSDSCLKKKNVCKNIKRIDVERNSLEPGIWFDLLTIDTTNWSSW